MSADGHAEYDRRATYEEYAYALGLFWLGVTLLGHGMAATVFLGGTTPVTVALPLVGAAVAYRSFVGLLPPDSSLSADGLVVLLAVATTGVVNLLAPAVYRIASVPPSVAGRPAYWPALVAAVGGFAALGFYELLAERVARSGRAAGPEQVTGRYALAKLVGAGVAGLAVGALLVVAPAQPVAPFSATDALAGVGGALLGAVVFDYGRGDGEQTEAEATPKTETTKT